MKSKLEEDLDKEFEKLGMKLRVYHYTEPYLSFNAITVVTNDKNTDWISIAEDIQKSLKQITEKEFNHSTELLNEMVKRDYYGIAICNKRDTFSRQRGRVISKGRLLKHIKEK